MTVRQLNRVCHMAAEAAGLGSWITPHPALLNARFADRLASHPPLRIVRQWQPSTPSTPRPEKRSGRD
jgi:hypothetical protein